jgi:1-acyl-sn-glycerol-3-phosphate acyltransferase
MQRVVFDEPYEFVPPFYSDWGPHVLRFYVRRYLRKAYGVQSIECRNVDRLRESLAKKRSIMLAPNHCRLSDPMVLGVMALEAHTYLHAMASWHLFKQSRFQTTMIRLLGAFSLFREGSDRKSLDTAIDILVARRRPLIVFPEGALTRHNDLIREMMDGPSFIARQAAKRLKKIDPAVEVVIHPVAVRYSFLGDMERAVTPTLDDLETRLSWQPQRHRSIVSRIRRIAEALLSLKEIEFLGATRAGDPFERAEFLIESVLEKLEKEWQVNDSSGGIIARGKRLRTAILPEMITNNITQADRERRWRHLTAIYYVQQMASYPREYILPEKNYPERIVETVERLEEDFTDRSRKYGPFHAVVDVGEAIPVGTERERGAASDPIMDEVRRQLQGMIDAMAAERTPV